MLTGEFGIRGLLGFLGFFGVFGVFDILDVLGIAQFPMRTTKNPITHFSTGYVAHYIGGRCFGLKLTSISWM
jgi:hypothetical protein